MRRQFFDSLAASGHLGAAGLRLALVRLGVLPTSAAWQRFIDRLLLVAGVLLLLAGVVFFFAYNWAGLHRFAKFALIAAPLTASALAAARAGTDNAAGKACLAAAVVLVGAFVAVAGQVYQSGADSELLFAGWAVLALPWVIAGSAAWLWLFWLLLVNAALGLYLFGRLELWALLFLRDGMFWAPIVLNGLALGAFESLRGRFRWLDVGYAPRLVALAAGAYATILMSLWWFFSEGKEWQTLRYTPVIYVLWLGLTLWFYQFGRRDLVPLAIAALSAIVVVTSGLIKGIGHQHDPFGMFLMIALVVAAMTAGAAAWLRALSRQWQAPESDAHG